MRTKEETQALSDGLCLAAALLSDITNEHKSKSPQDFLEILLGEVATIYEIGQDIEKSHGDFKGIPNVADVITLARIRAKRKA